MTSLLRRARHSEEGAALILAIAMLFIASIYGIVVFSAVHQAQEGSTTIRNVTSARGAADAGAEAAIFSLGVSGSPLWEDSASGTTAPRTDSGGDWEYTYTVSPDPADSTRRLVRATGTYPAGTGDEVSVEVLVEQSAPRAFDFSMFADEQIDIHHHGSLLSPRIITTKVHSNGGAKLPTSSEFIVEDFTAVGEIEMGGGSGGHGGHPTMSNDATDGDYGPGGYSWRYDINQATGPRCYPFWNPYPAGGEDVTEPAPDTPAPFRPNDSDNPGNECSGAFFTGGTTIVGDVFAESIGMGSRANVAASATYGAGGVTYGNTAQDRYTISGDVIRARSGNIHVKTGEGAEINGEAVDGDPGDVISCTNCGQGGPGTIAGDVVITPSAPEAIDYPSLDYESTYRVRAQDQQDSPGACPNLDCGAQHIWEKSDDWLEYITDPTTPTGSNSQGRQNKDGFYWYIANNGDHRPWTCQNGFPPDYIRLLGDWYIQGGVDLDAEDVNGLVEEQLAENPNCDNVFDAEERPAMPIVIAGSLVSPDGGMGMQGRLYLVGRNNPTDFVEVSGDDNEHVSIDLCRFLNREQPGPGDSACGASLDTADVEPGVMAAGGSIDANDADKDDPYEEFEDYDANSVNATWVRGLVYAGTWDEDAQRSEGESHHWHAQDPKNSARIFGAQVGSKLHNCNNFEFSYDAIVSKAFGFTSEDASGVQVIRWDEL